MSMNYKILVVDDTVENIEILNELLGDSYDVLSALDGEFALEIVYNDKPDLILLDIVMPDIDGFEVCRRLQKNETTKDIPIVFITAKTDEQIIEEAYSIGGADYITKPFKPRELLAKVKRELTIQGLMSELKLSASTDSMTGLYNRRYFKKNSLHILNIAKRYKKETAIFILDIDKFKDINDNYGHDVGDKVIINLAQSLIEHTRQSDLLCRWGGEEFVVLLPETTIQGALISVEKIRQSVEDMSLQLDSKNELKFTISIGVSTINIQEENCLELAINKADEALYKAKNSGRNKVCV